MNRAFVVCHERGYGRIPVPPERLRRCQVDAQSLARCLASELGTDGPREVVPDRLWRLPALRGVRTRITVYLALGARWEDASRLFADQRDIRTDDVPLILVPSDVPDRGAFPARVRLLPLTDWLSLGEEGLALAAEEMLSSAAGKAAKQQGIMPFRVPPGTRWEQVHIDLINDEIVDVAVGGARSRRSFDEMGLADQRSRPPGPGKLWVVLVVLAAHGGELAPGEGGFAETGKLQKWVSDLRKHLLVLFPGIEGTPVRPFSSERGYRTRSVLTDSRPRDGR